MKLAATLAAVAVLSLSNFSAHATPIAPGVNLTLSNGTSNVAFLGTTTPGTFVASDTLHSVTVVYTDTPGVADVFAVTDVCATANALTPCPIYTLSIGDANAAGLAVGVGLSASAQTDTTFASQLATIKLDGSLGLSAETLDFALPPTAPSSTSPVPEPASLSLMATGLLGAVGAVRRRMRG